MRPSPQATVEEASEDHRRAKVEDDDLEIGDEILKLSQRRDFYGSNDIKRRGSDGLGLPRESAETDFTLGSESQAPSSQLERRSESFGASPQITTLNAFHAFNAIVSDTKKE